MKERDDVEDDVVLVPAEGDLRAHRVEVEVALAEGDALGQTGGTARVEELGDRVLVDLRVARVSGAAGDEGLVLVAGDPAGLTLHDHETRTHGELRRKLLDERREVRVKEDDPRPGVLQDVRDLGWREPDVDRVEDRPGLEDAVVRLEQVVGVVGDERDAVAGLDAEAVEGVRQLVGPLGPGAIGELEVAVDDADLVAEVGRRPVAELEHREGHEHGSSSTC